MEAPAVPAPSEWGGLLRAIVEAFGPAGAAMALMLGFALWWIKHISEQHQIERAALVAQVKDSEEKRRQDGISQFAQLGAFIDTLRGTTDKIAATLTDLRVAFAEKGIKT